MLMFTLAIYCLHYQFALIHGPNIPGSYAILLFTALDCTSITSHIHSWVLFCFGSVSSFFLLCHHSSPVAYLTPTDLGSSSFSVLSFCLFILFMGFSRQDYWSGLPFPSPVDHILSELSTMTHTSWVALHGMAHGFIELDKAVVRVITLISFLWLWFSTSALWWIKINKRLMEASCGRDWLRGKLGLVLTSNQAISTTKTQEFIYFNDKSQVEVKKEGNVHASTFS